MLVAALLLAGSAVPPPAQTASLAAVDKYRQACMLGSLKVSKAVGRILNDDELVTFVDVVDWNRTKTEHTVVKFNKPRSTYLILAQYKEVQPRGFTRICVVVSNSLTKDDAAAALLEGTPKDAEPKIRWVPDMYFPEWTIDLPKLGYRKRMKIRSDGSILLEVAVYGAGPVNQIPVEMKK